MNFVCTGIYSAEHEDVEAVLKAHGAQVSATVTGLVTHLLLGETGKVGPYNTLTGKGTKKYKDAMKKKSVKHFSEEDVLALLKK